MGGAWRTIQVALKADTSNYSTGLRGAARETEGFERQVTRSTGRATSAWGNLGKVGTVLGAVALSAGLAFGAASAGAVIWGTKVAASNEQTIMTLRTLLGDQEKATAFFGQLKDFAAETPFDLEGLSQASTRLLAVGVNAEDVLPLMEGIGDSIAAFGGDSESIGTVVRALGQMQAKGKVQQEELQQIAETGIPIMQALAAEMGVSVPEAQAKITAGQVKVNQVFDAFTKYSGPLSNFKGLMDEQATSLAGLWSTLKDNVAQGLGSIVTATLPGVKDEMATISDYILGAFADIGDGAAPLVNRLAPSLTRGFIAMADGAMLFAGESRPLADALLDILDLITSRLAPVLEDAGQLLGDLAAEVGTSIEGMLDEIGPAIEDNADSWREMIAAAEPMIPMVGDLVTAMTPLVVSMIGASTVALDFVSMLLRIGKVVPGLIEGPLVGLARAFGMFDDGPDPGVYFGDLAGGAAEAAREVPKVADAVEDYATRQAYANELAADFDGILAELGADTSFRQATADLADTMAAYEENLATLAGTSEKYRDLQSDIADQAAKDAKAIADAQSDLVRVTEQDQQAIADARQAAADQAVQDSRAVQDADRGVAEAERDLVVAKQDAKAAEEGLSAARQEAARRLEDLRAAERGDRIGVEEARIALSQARFELQQASDDPTTPWSEREQARLRVYRAQLALSDAQRQARDTTAELNTQEALGVVGSAEVVAARDAITAANTRVQEAQQRVTDAERAAAEARVTQSKNAIESARAVADAETKAAEDRAAALARIRDAEVDRDLHRAEGQQRMNDLIADATKKTGELALAAEAATQKWVAAAAKAGRSTSEIRTGLEQLRIFVAPGSPFAMAIDDILAQMEAVADTAERLRTQYGIQITSGGDLRPLGQRARGGPVKAGHPYVVGEHRPELFVPDSDGMVLPSVPWRQSGRTPAAVTMAPGGMPAGGMQVGGARTVVHTHTWNLNLPAVDPSQLAGAISAHQAWAEGITGGLS